MYSGRESFMLPAKQWLRQIGARALGVGFTFISCAAMIAVGIGPCAGMFYVFAWSERVPAHKLWDDWMIAVSANRVQGYHHFLRANPSTITPRAGYTLEHAAKQLFEHRRKVRSDGATRSSEGTCRLFMVYHREGRSSRPHGFVDAVGRMVIRDLPFDEAMEFSFGFAAVKKENLWGFIDEAGKVRVAPQFHEVRAFSEGLAAVRGGNLWGFVDETGNVRTGLAFTEVRDVVNGRAAVYSKEYCGYIDGRGNVVIPLRFKSCSSFRQDRALVKLDHDPRWNMLHTAIIDSNGHTIKNLREDLDWQFDPPFSEGMAPVRVESSLEWVADHSNFKLWSYVSDSGVLGRSKYYKAEPFSEGLAAVQDWSLKGSQQHPMVRRTFTPYEGSWGYIDKQFRMIIPHTYENANKFHDGLAWVTTHLGDAQVNRVGRVVIQHRNVVGEFSEGLAITRFDGGSGFIDRQGFPVIPGLFKTADRFCGGVARVRISEEIAGLINLSGKLIWIDTRSKSIVTRIAERITPKWWPTYTELRAPTPSERLENRSESETTRP